jgi:hypothetical protein
MDYAAILVLWFLLPQQINENLIPLVLALLVNSLPGEMAAREAKKAPVAAG